LFPSVTLTEFYRFALLLTGDSGAAQKCLVEALHEGDAKLVEIRQRTARRASLIHRIRERCLRSRAANDRGLPRAEHAEGVERGPAATKTGPFVVAQCFSTLPEPQRSALALFYLDLLETPEIARLLKMETEDLARTLADARAILSEAMHETPA